MGGIFADAEKIFVVEIKFSFANMVSACENAVNKRHSIAGFRRSGSGQADRELLPCALM